MALNVRNTPAHCCADRSRTLKPAAPPWDPSTSGHLCYVPHARQRTTHGCHAQAGARLITAHVNVHVVTGHRLQHVTFHARNIDAREQHGKRATPSTVVRVLVCTSNAAATTPSPTTALQRWNATGRSRSSPEQSRPTCRARTPPAHTRAAADTGSRVGPALAHPHAPRMG